MTIVESLKKMPKSKRGIALTIGNFEGYHIGHREIVGTLIDEAKKQNLLTCIITFKNHPLELLKGYEPERLWSRCDKIITFYREGIDLLTYLNFSREFAYQEPEEFLELIRKSINPSLLCLGETFRFGRENRGDIDTIRNYGKKYHWTFHAVKDLEMFGVKVSSTYIRNRIKEGDFKVANSMLGRKYSIYLEPYENKIDRMKLFIDNMAVPKNGTYKGEMIDLNSKDYYDTIVRFEDRVAKIIDGKPIRSDSLYSFNFDSNVANIK